MFDRLYRCGETVASTVFSPKLVNLRVLAEEDQHTNDSKSFVTFLSLIVVFSFALRPQTRTPGIRAGVQIRFFTTHSNVCFVSFCRTFSVNEVLNSLWWKIIPSLKSDVFSHM